MTLYFSVFFFLRKKLHNNYFFWYPRCAPAEGEKKEEGRKKKKAAGKRSGCKGTGVLTRPAVWTETQGVESTCTNSTQRSTGPVSKYSLPKNAFSQWRRYIVSFNWRLWLQNIDTSKKAAEQSVARAITGGARAREPECRCVLTQPAQCRRRWKGDRLCFGFWLFSLLFCVFFGATDFVGLDFRSWDRWLQFNA